MKEMREKEIISTLAEVGLWIFFLIGICFTDCFPNKLLPFALKLIVGVATFFNINALIADIIQDLRQEKVEAIFECIQENENILENFEIRNWAEKCGYTSAQLKKVNDKYNLCLRRQDVETFLPIDVSSWYRPICEILFLLLSALGMFILLFGNFAENVVIFALSMLLFWIAHDYITSSLIVNQEIVESILSIKCKRESNLLKGKLYSFDDICDPSLLFSSVYLKETTQPDEYEMIFREVNTSQTYSFTFVKFEVQMYLDFK